MVWLLVCVALTVAFVHTMRLGQHVKGKIVWIGAINYIVAQVGAGIWWTLTPGAQCGGNELVFGVLVGAGLAAAYFAINANIRTVGVGVTNTVERISSVVIPVLGAMVLWGTFPEALWQRAGLGLVLVSLPLLAQERAVKGKVTGPRWVAPALLAALFIIPGCTVLSFAGYEQAAKRLDPQPAFFMVMFTTAAIANLIAASTSGMPGKKELRMGILLGAINLSSNYCFYKALAELPLYVVVPTMAAGVILVSSGVAALVWKERYSRKALVGMGIAGIALILINVNPKKDAETPKTPVDKGHGLVKRIEAESGR